MTSCGSCGQPIFWALTLDGRRIPMDTDHGPKGNVAIVGRAKATPIVLTLSRSQLDRLARQGAPSLYRSHFATCPDAEQWRNREEST